MNTTNNFGRSPPRRFRPAPGRLLTIENIRGPWRPSGATVGAGLFAIVWSMRGACYWAPLHDFEPSDQLRLVDDCRRLDVEQFGADR